jgi:hypothetical protein
MKDLIMIPINEELSRLHQPVILCEEDSQWDVSYYVAYSILRNSI